MCMRSIFSSMIFCKWIFGSHFVLKAIVTAQSSLSSNYCLRVTAEGANQNA
jgi:hypothetical protein